jgi:hypothetical protein
MSKSVKLLSQALRAVVASLPLLVADKQHIVNLLDAAEKATGKDLDGDGDVAGKPVADANGKVSRGRGGKFAKIEPSA